MRVSDAQAIEYFKRCYTAADGLWFVKTEEDGGFDRALEIDRRVWEVLPKIQARMLKEWCGAGAGAAALACCLAARYELEGYGAQVEPTAGGGVRVCITACPWLEKMKSSGRGDKAAAVARVICPAEHGVWAREFGLRARVAMPCSMCEGAASCAFEFEAAP